MLNLPLCLTLSRVLLAPLFIAVYLYHSEMGMTPIVLPYVLLLIACISELADLFDGILARKHDMVTDLGKILDPMADSIFRLSVLLAFTQGVIQLPVLLVSVFFYRDSLISTLRTVCALRGVALSARKSGKCKAVILAALSFFIIIMMIPYSLGVLSVQTLQEMSIWSVSFVAMYVVYTGIEYVYANKTHIKKVLGL